MFVQTVRHRDYFLPVETGGAEPADAHLPPTSTREALISLGLLAVALVSVVGLAKTVSPAIEHGVRAMGAPLGVVGVAIALVVLPETHRAAGHRPLVDLRGSPGGTDGEQGDVVALRRRGEPRHGRPHRCDDLCGGPATRGGSGGQ